MSRGVHALPSGALCDWLHGRARVQPWKRSLHSLCVCVCVHLFLSLVEDVFYDEWLRMCRGMHVVSGVINHKSLHKHQIV